MQYAPASTEMGRPEVGSDAGCQFVIRPNHSMSWQGNSAVFLSLLLLSGIIVGFFAWKGLWMIAPFSSLELIFVGLILYTVWHKTKIQETVTITDDAVTVCSGISKPEQCCSFPRRWVQVILSPASLQGYPSRLWLRSHGCQVEIGTCLNDLERKHLAKEISTQIHTP